MPDSALPFPLFVLAPPRSFTTLVTGMLSQHPQIYGGPELVLFYRPTLHRLWREGRNNRIDDAQIRHGILRFVAEVYFGEQSDEAIQGAEHWCAARQHLPNGEVFNELRRKVAPFHLIEKSPYYSINPEALQAINTHCPDARYLFLTRHPVAQGVSANTLSKGWYTRNLNSTDTRSGEVVYDPQTAWHDLNMITLRFLEADIPPDRYRRVKGEDLLANPVEGLADICRWLGLRDDEAAMEGMQHPETSPFSCLGPISALFGNDPNFLRNPYFTPSARRAVPELDAPLPWRDDGYGLREEVITLAREFGY